MPVSDSYHDSLIESLKAPHYAAVYLETHLEGDEYEFEPELLKLAFSHVLEALGSQILTPEQMTIQIKQLEELMQKPGKEAIHHLELWLKSLGLKLTITVAPEIQEINNQNDVVNSVEVTA
ncbi:MAG: DNA-binding protein [Microcystaceae cyanobacterium]